MKYQQISNLTKVITYYQLQAENPMVSLAPDGTEILLDEWHVVAPSPQPIYDQYTMRAVEVQPQDFQQTWMLEDLSSGEIDQNIINAKQIKYDESSRYADQLIDGANASPYLGANTTAAKNKRKVASRINHSSNGKPKSDTDKDRDDVLADYSDNVYDAQDSADDIIEGQGVAQDIYAIDIPSAVNWPVWISPE